MGTADWPLLTDPFSPDMPVVPPEDPGIAQGSSLSVLGTGIIRPLVRDKKADFAWASGQRLVGACVGQVLGTTCDNEFTGGELPWRTEFGSKLFLLRQRLNSQALADQARRFVAEAINRWEPRVRLKEVHVSRADAPTGGKLNVLSIRVTYDYVGQNSAGNQVLASNLKTTINLGS
jgi:phage baseplate assembly protein W